MLLGLGYGCRIRVCVRHGYCSIFVSFSISLKDRSVIPISEYVSDTGTSRKMKSSSNIFKHLSFFVGSTCAKKKSRSAHMIDDLLSLRSMLHFETDSVTCKIVES